MRLEINPAECNELLHLIGNALSDLRVEVRRTSTSDFRSQLHQEEDLLRGLQEKLQQLSEIPAPLT